MSLGESWAMPVSDGAGVVVNVADRIGHFCPKRYAIGNLALNAHFLDF